MGHEGTFRGAQWEGVGVWAFSVSRCLFLTCKSNEHHIATLVSQYYTKVFVLAPVVAQFPESQKVPS